MFAAELLMAISTIFSGTVFGTNAADAVENVGWKTALVDQPRNGQTRGSRWKAVDASKFSVTFCCWSMIMLVSAISAGVAKA